LLEQATRTVAESKIADVLSSFFMGIFLFSSQMILVI
jgi:hypothetical protein